MEVVVVSFDRVGPGDVCQRPVHQYWSKKGNLLAEFDHSFHSPDVAAYEVARLREALSLAEASAKLVTATEDEVANG